jgi:hypothetical protein
MQEVMKTFLTCFSVHFTKKVTYFWTTLQGGVYTKLEQRLLTFPFQVCDLKGARIAQSVQRLATGWTTEGSMFESR